MAEMLQEPVNLFDHPYQAIHRAEHEQAEEGQETSDYGKPTSYVNNIVLLEFSAQKNKRGGFWREKRGLGYDGKLPCTRMSVLLDGRRC